MAYFEVTYVTCSKRKLARGLEENLDKNFIVIHCTLQKQGITRISLAANSCFIPVRNALARILRLVNPSKPSEPRDQIERSTMQLPVVCPQCHNEFQLTDVMYSQILSRVRGELAVETTAKQRVLDEQTQLLSHRAAQLDADRKSMVAEIQKAVDLERIRLASEAAKQAV